MFIDLMIQETGNRATTKSHGACNLCAPRRRRMNRNSRRMNSVPTPRFQ